MYLVFFVTNFVHFGFVMDLINCQVVSQFVHYEQFRIDYILKENEQVCLQLLMKQEAITPVVRTVRTDASEDRKTKFWQFFKEMYFFTHPQPFHPCRGGSRALSPKILNKSLYRQSLEITKLVLSDFQHFRDVISRKRLILDINCYTE